jgi:hypothetical protein
VAIAVLEEADADGFDIFDIESAILAGEIVERQKDRDTGESKYVIIGGRSMTVRSPSWRSLALPGGCCTS